MVTRKTQCGWIALGGTLCLFGVVLVFKMNNSNRAGAQTQPPSKASVGAAAGGGTGEEGASGPSHEARRRASEHGGGQAPAELAGPSHSGQGQMDAADRHLCRQSR